MVGHAHPRSPNHSSNASEVIGCEPSTSCAACVKASVIVGIEQVARYNSYLD
jgi:hypothetical protein